MPIKIMTNSPAIDARTFCSWHLVHQLAPLAVRSEFLLAIIAEV